MKIVNRGYIIVRPTAHFWKWAKQHTEEDLQVEEGDDVEPNIYLIEENFFDIEPLVEQNFKKIFKTELMMVTEDEDLMAGKINDRSVHGMV
jgi:hypothetical protein